MDKWRHKGKSAVSREDSLLPPTRRVANSANPLPDKRSSIKWSIDAFFKKVSSILEAQTSSSSLEDLSESQRRRYKGKSKGNISRPSGYAFKSREDIDYSPPGVYRNNYNNNNNNNNEYTNNEDLLNANMSLDALEARLTNNSAYSRSSDGSLEGGGGGARRLRKDKVKARVEAKRDELCVGDSSMDESSNEDPVVKGSNGLPKTESSGAGKRRSRASRTERYLKRMCNGAANVNSPVNPRPIPVDQQAVKANAFQPIDRVSRNPVTPCANEQACFDNDVPKENLYARHSDIGVNPLVQQTLQYFSEFDRNMATCQQQKVRKTYPAQHERRNAHKSQIYPSSSYHNLDNEPTPPNVIPPKPPSRDHTSRILINGTSLDKYQQMLRYMQKSPESHFSEIGPYLGTKLPPHTPNSELRNINEENNYVTSSNTKMGKSQLSLSPSTSPKTEPANTNTIEITSSLIERNPSPLSQSNKPKHLNQASSLQDYQNSSYVPHNDQVLPTIEKQKNGRRTSKNLEEALCELEAIYNSLQLGDEELLERAEKRTMEEFHYKGFTASPDFYGNEDPATRSKTWADNALNKEEPEIPDRLKDDMAYRRMHPKERPPSTDGQSSLSIISYLMTSPIPSRREMRYIDPKRKPRRKEPDVTLDDVVFRSMQYANNTLKVVEPQPPFGIPLGPITTATESDYLHTNPTKSERSRSPYIPSCEPDLVTDDLAFRNLRKDAQPAGSSRQPSPSFLNGSITGGSSCTSPLSFGLKKKRAVRSLSANLYGLINKQSSFIDLDTEDQTSTANDSIFDDIFDDVPIKHINRRTSDPELMCPNWQTKNTWNSLDINKNKREEMDKLQDSRRQTTKSSDVDQSSRSCDESSDEKILLQDRPIFPETNIECKTMGSDLGSNYLSSNCNTPPPSIPVCSSEPFTEQEISVYKKLCQDLENLVQLTKGVETMPSFDKPVISSLSIPSKEVNVATNNSASNMEKIETNDLLVMKDPSKSRITEIIEHDVDKDKSDECKEKIKTSPVKQEISMILDNLKSLREDSSCINSSCSGEEDNKKEKENINDAVDDKSFKEITKEIYDLVVVDDVDIEKLERKEKEVELCKEDEEREDRIDDNVFFRNVQLAKLSGEWKESTPNNNYGNNAVIGGHRRTSLTGPDSNSNWEGEIRSCEQRVSMVCNASHDMSRLTAKYICYITNHITAQFCLLLVFFLVLLLAIVTVP